jgi:hypothetical protein
MPSVVDLVVDADAGGGGGGLLMPGACISPPNANVALEITTMAAKRKHRSLFIVFGPFGVEAVWLSDREIVERKNHNIISRRCD